MKAVLFIRIFLHHPVKLTHLSLVSIIIFFSTTHCSLKAYCAILVRHSNFCHRASPGVSPHESTQRRKVELWVRNVR